MVFRGEKMSEVFKVKNYNDDEGTTTISLDNLKYRKKLSELRAVGPWHVSVRDKYVDISRPIHVWGINNETGETSWSSGGEGEYFSIPKECFDKATTLKVEKSEVRVKAEELFGMMGRVKLGEEEFILIPQTKFYKYLEEIGLRY
jgi:hypothetical protein